MMCVQGRTLFNNHQNECDICKVHFLLSCLTVHFGPELREDARLPTLCLILMRGTMMCSHILLLNLKVRNESNLPVAALFIIW